jgi:hypothetical protein
VPKSASAASSPPAALLICGRLSVFLTTLLYSSPLGGPCVDGCCADEVCSRRPRPTNSQ